jgi:hypothetical protein
MVQWTKAVRTHRVLNRPLGRDENLARLKRGKKPVARSMIEPQALPPSITDRRTGRFKSMPHCGTGIMFRLPLKLNDAKLLNETGLALLYTYQQCRDAYSWPEIRNAKRCYHRVRRAFLQWGQLFVHSKVVKYYWRVISVTLRIAQSVAKQPGRPHCGNDRASSLNCQSSSFGLKKKGQLSSLRKIPAP